MPRHTLICVTVASLLPLACSGSPEPASKTASEQAASNQTTSHQTTSDDQAAGEQVEPGPIVIVEPPEPEQTEPLSTAVDDTPDQDPMRQPEAAPEADWCPDCPVACIHYVTMMEACLASYKTRNPPDFGGLCGWAIRDSNPEPMD